MMCPKCGVEVPANAAYCERCFARIDAAEPPSAEPEPTLAQQAPQPDPNPAEAPGAARPVRPEPRPAPGKGDPDVELWVGRYSPRAMIGTWLLLTVVTALFVLLGIWLARMHWLWFHQSLIAWLVLLVIPAVLWVYYYGVYLWRRHTIRYRLTTYRFFHEKGFVRHVKDCIEVIDIDDLALEQSLWDRLIGVGTVRIRSKDPGEPILALHGLADAETAFQKLDTARRDERIRRGLNLV